MNPNFTIRAATAADISVIVTHRVQMFEEMAGHQLDQGWIEPFIPWLERTLASGTYRGWLAQTPGGQAVASAGLLLADWPPGPLDQQPYRGYVLNVYTEPNYRRHGLARQIMTALLDECRQCQVRVISLHASDQGRPLYADLGFAPTNEMRLVLQPPDGSKEI